MGKYRHFATFSCFLAYRRNFGQKKYILLYIDIKGIEGDKFKVCVKLTAINVCL